MSSRAEGQGLLHPLLQAGDRLEGVAQEVEDTIVKIMKEAASC